MGVPSTLLDGRRPTDGMLSLAKDIADNRERDDLGQSSVPARVYTDPEYWAREKSAIYGRLPQILCPSALLPDTGMACPTMPRAGHC